MGLTVNGNDDWYQANMQKCNQDMSNAHKLYEPLFDKDAAGKKVVLSRKDIQQTLNISKKEAKQLYKIMNTDGKKGITEEELEIYQTGIEVAMDVMRQIKDIKDAKARQEVDTE